jgi:hypothetical protein
MASVHASFEAELRLRPRNSESQPFRGQLRPRCPRQLPLRPRRLARAPEPFLSDA